MKKSAILLFLIWGCCSKVFSQKITTGNMWYLNSVASDTELDDSIIRISVKTLFTADNNSLRKVLFNIEDTVFYTNLRGYVFIMPRKDWVEFNLHSIEKIRGVYYLKCVVTYHVPETDLTDFMCFVNLPFVVVNKEIKFKNYYVENGRTENFVEGKMPGIYTNKENAENLDTICDYIHQISTRFGIPIDTGHKLFYVYFRDNKSPQSIIGVENYTLDVQGKLTPIGNDFFLFDKVANGFYKHELAHYVFDKKKPTRFFDEGFASYLGGSKSGCDNKSDYEKLLSFLEKNNDDSVMLNILKRKFLPQFYPEKQYGLFYYQLASFTMYLMVKTYGNGLFENEFVKSAIKENSPEAILSFMTANLKPRNKTLPNYYIEELQNYFKRK